MTITRTCRQLHRRALGEPANGNRLLRVVGLALLLFGVAPAWAATKPLYLYSDPSTTLSRAVPTIAQPVVNISGSNATESWTLSPGLQGNVVFDAGNHPVVLWLAQSGPGTNRDLTITLRSTDPLAPVLGSLVTTNLALGAAPTEQTFNVPIASATTVRAGYQVILDVQNNSPNIVFGAFVIERLTQVYPAATGGNSRVDVQTNSVIRVDLVEVYTAPYPAGSLVSLPVPTGSTVYLRSQVSDPFGSYDIGNARLTVSNPGGAVEVNAAAMPMVNDSGNAIKIFEQPFTASGIGTWSVSVTAEEGAEGAVTHTAADSFVTTPAPDLSASTSAVWDLNGGNADPGETLRYTITIKESSGNAATNVRVVSNLPSNTTGLGVIAIPGGATDNSTAGGLDISGFSVPAYGSKTIVFDVTIATGAAPGDQVDYAATVINPAGANYNAIAPTVVVSASSVAASGNKPLYLYANNTMSRVAPTTTQGTIAIGELANASWTLSPAAQAALALDSGGGSAFFPVTLWLSRTGNFFAGNDRSITVALSSNGSPTGVFGSLTLTKTLTDSRQAVLFNIPISNDVVLSAGDTVTLTVTNNSTGFGARGVNVYPSVSADHSTVVLNSNDVINVDSVSVYDTSPALITSASINTQINVRATVSDPFGSADISSATFDLIDPQGTTVIDDGAMNVMATTASTKTFVSATAYTIPANGAGSWTVTVTAKEGLEDEISHTASTTLGITAPSLTVVKIADTASAAPGGLVTYTITVTNTGNAAASNVMIEDALGQLVAIAVDPFGGGTPFQFVPGMSGLTPGTPVYSSDDGASWNHPLAGVGYDPAVTNFRIPMLGTMAVSSSFVLRYRAQVK